MKPLSAPVVHAAPMLGAKLFQSVSKAFVPLSSIVYCVGEPWNAPGLYRLPRPVTTDPTVRSPGPVTPNTSSMSANE